MPNFIEKYKELLKDKKETDKEAHFCLYSDPLLSQLKGDDKIMDLLDVDQEETLHRSSKKPIPGMLYTFVNRKSLFSKGLHDPIPLVVCLRSFETKMSGFNLNLMSPAVRLKFIQAMYEISPDFFDRYDNGESEDEDINKIFISQIAKLNDRRVMDILSTLSGGIDFSVSLRVYDLTSVDLIRMIEVPKWQYIPFHNNSKNIENSILSKIYKMYEKR